MCVFEVRASSSPQATFVPNFVCVAASVAELAHGEKSRTQSFNQSINQSPSLFDAPGTKACALENIAEFRPAIKFHRLDGPKRKGHSRLCFQSRSLQ